MEYGVFTGNNVYSIPTDIKGILCKCCNIKKPHSFFSEKSGLYATTCNECIKKNTLEKKEKYILYLHPTVDNPFYGELESYWAAARNSGIQNSALEYPFHMTLTSFFYTDDICDICEKISKRIEGLKTLENGSFLLKFDSVRDSPGFKAFYMKPGKEFGTFVKNVQQDIKGESEKNEKNEKNDIQDKLHFTLYNNVPEKDVSWYKEQVGKISPRQIRDMWNIILWKKNKNEWKIVKRF